MKTITVTSKRMKESGTVPDCAGLFHSGFTLIELMVSITVLSVLMLFMTNVVGVVQNTWAQSNSKVSEFREARMAMDAITRSLSQATLNTYWNISGSTYQRQSELQFVCGQVAVSPGHLGLLDRAAAGVYPTHGVFFQAPLGTTIQAMATGTRVNTENMSNLLCGRGYFIQLSDDAGFRPSFLNYGNYDKTVPKRLRYRLMEYSPPAESNKIYALKPITSYSKEWFRHDVTEIEENETVVTRGITRPIAENVIALVISPQVNTRTDTTNAPTWIAPNYDYDSTLSSNLIPKVTTGTQVSQHLLPPMLKITMVVIDSVAAEKLSGDAALRTDLAAALAPLFDKAASYSADLQTLTNKLTKFKLRYRVFTTTVNMKQARWSL